MPRPALLRPLLVIPALTALTALALLLVAWRWYVSDADLRAVRAEPGNPPAPAVRGAVADPAIARLVALGARPGLPTLFATYPRDPLPAEFWVELHGAARAVDRAVDGPRVDPGPCWLYHLQGLLLAQAWRITTAPAAEVPVLTDDAVALLLAIEPDFNGRWAQQEIIARLTKALAARCAAPADALSPAERAAVRASLLRLRDGLWADRASAEAALFQVLLAAFAGPPRPRALDPADGRLVAAFDRLRWPLLHRWNRAALLRELAARWRASVAATAPADLDRRQHAIPHTTIGPTLLADANARVALALPACHQLLLDTLAELDRLIARLAAPP